MNHRHSFIGFSLALAGILCGRAWAGAIEGPVTLDCGAGLVTFSSRDGAILAVREKGKVETLWRTGKAGLWRLRFRSGSELTAARVARRADPRSFQMRRGPDSLRLEYRSPEAEVTITVMVRAGGVDFVSRVSPKKEAVLDFALPARLRFDADQVKQVICPANGNASVGTAFLAVFFRRQPEARPSSWQHERCAGPAGYSTLFGGPLDQRADHDPPTPLRVTDEGRRWLGETIAQAVNRVKAVVNRPPTRQQVDLVLVDSQHGPYFAAKRLGNGRIWRLGGSTGEEARSTAAALVGAVIETLCKSPGKGRRKVGLIALRHGPEKGGWAPVKVSDWRLRLQRIAAENPALQYVELDTVGSMLRALESPDYVAILNPYGEWTPVPASGAMRNVVAAVGRFVRAGGNWFEVGGYPFYYELRPVRYYHYAVDYPAGFADFLHLDAAGGSVSVYRVQPRSWQPWAGQEDKRAIFVPGRLGCGADALGAYCDRSFVTYVKPGETWQAPRVRMTVGKPAAAALKDYCAANGIFRRLEDKMPAALLGKLKRSVLVYYGGSCAEKLAHLDKLPVPALIHFADYLRGGFDKQYPDHLPPRPAFGTPEQFRRFFAKCHEHGLLVMPYTNPTWWCDHPKGPTFEREGVEPLLRTLTGKLSHEQYGANDGWTVCHWHPAVRAANRKTLEQFTKEYPADVLFQDQCGARRWRYDTNPASPAPYAYTEGLLSMVQEDCRSKPLATEAGWDRVVNWESLLCGMAWELAPTEGGPPGRRMMKQKIPPMLWKVFPLAQDIAHDKCMMFYHDLGQFVTNRKVLAWTLGLGFCMSYRVGAAALEKDATREWLYWLDRVQKSVCARYVGQPVRHFEHDRDPHATKDDDGLLRAVYGPVHVAANLGPKVRRAGGHDLAPYGFRVTAPGLVAANLARVGGREFGPKGVSFVCEGDRRQAEVWVYARPRRRVNVEMPAPLSPRVPAKPVSVRIVFDGRPATSAECTGNVLSFRTPALAGRKRIGVPPSLADKPPRTWKPLPNIGVLDLGPGIAPAWTTIRPEDWLKAFQAAPFVRSMGVEVKRLTTVAELGKALEAGVTEWLVIVNPYGERFPCEPGRSMQMLKAIRRYVEHGGNWWETAGYSFYLGVSPASSGATADHHLGRGGMAMFGIPVGGGKVNMPPEPLHATRLGQAILGAELSARIARFSSSVNRFLPRSAADPGHAPLVAGEKQDFIGGYRLDGWGWLWRIGGFDPNPNVAVPVVVATTAYLYAHPPLPVRATGVRYLWHAQVRPGP